MTRRGLILVGVLLVITMSALVGTTLVLSVTAERAAIEGALRRDQARAVAWSGVRAAMAELSDQRDLLLEGDDPEFTEEWIADGEGSSNEAVVRLVAFPDGSLFQPEAARLDLNTATAEALAALPGVTSDIADAIVAARSRAPFTSVEELARVPDAAALLNAEAPADANPSATFASFDFEPESAPLADLLTTYAFDPQTTIGVEGVDPGVPRVLLRGEVPEDAVDQLAAWFDDALAEEFTQIPALDDPPETRAAYVQVVNDPGSDAERWGQLLDAVTVSPDPFAIGLVDINRAPAAVLQTLPGLNADLAAALVAARERLDAGQRLNPAWPLESGELTPEQFVAIAHRVTTRTLVWRVRVEAGFRDAADAIDDAQPLLPEADEFGVALEPTRAASELRHRVVLEAVIDAAAPRPRLAYLRDVTALDLIEAKRAAIAADDPQEPPEEAADAFPGDIEDDAPDAPNARESRVRRATRDATFQNRGQTFRSRLQDPTGDTAAVDNEPSPPSSSRAPDADAAPVPDGVDRRVGRWTPGGGR